MNTNDRTGTRNRVKCLCALTVLLLVSVFTVTANAENPPPIAWIRQFGTASVDRSTDVAADTAGNVFITGYTGSSRDAFVSKYDAAGDLAWTRLLGTSSSSDVGFGVTTDVEGNVLITGYTSGSLGGPNAGSDDAFVSKYDTTGNLVWTRQLGTSSSDQSNSVATDTAGNVFITGYTSGSLGGSNAGSYDAFVSKYDAAGNRLWTRQLGTSSYDCSYGVVTDAGGNVLIAGYTEGSLGGPTAGISDAFVSKYDTAGTFVWTRQLGSSSGDHGRDVAVDAVGNVFIVGDTGGSFGGPYVGGEFDAFVSKLDTATNPAWVRQVGTLGTDVLHGVATDKAGNLYVSGVTGGSLGGPNAGSLDAFVSKYDVAGNYIWTCQVGTSSLDLSYAVATDVVGNLFITGYTGGSLGGPNAGNYDAFIVKFAAITCLGDANNDQLINLADLQILGDHWLSSGANWATGDFTGDGLVNLADLQVLGDNWGYGVGADVSFDDALLALPGVGLNVPEPTALSLLMICCLAGELARPSRSKLRG